jgi:hypothetical protein
MPVRLKTQTSFETFPTFYIINNPHLFHPLRSIKGGPRIRCAIGLMVQPTRILADALAKLPPGDGAKLSDGPILNLWDDGPI